MVANCDRNCPLLRRMLIAASAFAIGFSLNAAAQTISSADNSTSGQTYSSSADYRAYLSTDALLGGSSSVDSADGSGASASPQYGGGRRSSSYPTLRKPLQPHRLRGRVRFQHPCRQRHQLFDYQSRQWRSKPGRGLWLRFQSRRRLELHQALRRADGVPVPSSGHSQRLSERPARPGVRGSALPASVETSIPGRSPSIPSSTCPLAIRAALYVDGWRRLLPQGDQLHRTRRRVRPLLRMHCSAGNRRSLLQ